MTTHECDWGARRSRGGEEGGQRREMRVFRDEGAGCTRAVRWFRRACGIAMRACGRNGGARDRGENQLILILFEAESVGVREQKTNWAVRTGPSHSALRALQWPSRIVRRGVHSRPRGKCGSARRGAAVSRGLGIEGAVRTWVRDERDKYVRTARWPVSMSAGLIRGVFANPTALLVQRGGALRVENGGEEGRRGRDGMRRYARVTCKRGLQEDLKRIDKNAERWKDSERKEIKERLVARTLKYVAVLSAAGGHQLLPELAGGSDLGLARGIWSIHNGPLEIYSDPFWKQSRSHFCLFSSFKVFKP
ncbi:hypothetical protein DFH09DRAFT_1092911 [Mycena vulgaris]|nr:hypothetical protein DFH09DRAFT_1092911 [Mycena vulgaris]